MSDLEAFFAKAQADRDLRRRGRQRVFEVIAQFATDERFAVTADDIADYLRGITLADLSSLRQR